MIIKKLFMIIFCTLFFCSVIEAKTGTYAMSFIDLVNTPYSASLSNAVTAVSDSKAMYINPASIANNKKMIVSAQLFDYLVDIQFKEFRIAQPYLGGNIALSYTWVDYGTYQATTHDDMLGGSSGLVKNKSSMLQLTYAKHLAKYQVGSSIKYLLDQLASYEADCIALDFGVQRSLGTQWMIGASMTNIGLKKVKYIDESAKIRALSRVGIQYTPIFFKSNMSMMFDYTLRNKDELVYSVGTTFRAHENFNIHLGTSDFSDLFGFSIGLGIKKGDLGINLSLKQQKEFSDIYRLSLSMEL